MLAFRKLTGLTETVLLERCLLHHPFFFFKEVEVVVGFLWCCFWVFLI